MSDILDKVADYARDILTNKITDGHKYHDAAHTQEVIENSMEIGINANLSEEEFEMAVIGAWFHDIGYLDSYEEHEKRGAEICKEFLDSQNYPEANTEIICDAILATKLGVGPATTIAKVLSDADLLHAGKKSFFDRAELLREEWKLLLGRTFTELEWIQQNINFLKKVEFHTDYARNNYEKRRKKNIKRLQKELRTLIAEEAGDTGLLPMDDEKEVPQEERKEQIKQEVLENNPKYKKKPDRGVETVFRITSRNHISLSAIADNKANMMISVNAIIISILFSTMVGKLAGYPHLIVPTIILFAVCLTCIVFAVLSTRPKVTDGFVSTDDIINRKGNLLFFGNFHRMTLDDYEFGMGKLIQDAEYLYGSMVRDIYFLGKVLEKKYRYLRICYDIFVSGLIITVISVALAFYFYQ